jgi:hypothetical protein
MAVVFCLATAFAYWCGGFEFVRGPTLLLFVLAEFGAFTLGFMCPIGDKP